MRIALLSIFLVVTSSFVHGASVPLPSDPHPITYQVIVTLPDLGANAVGVAVGGKVYQLELHPTVPMLYTGIGPSSDPYHYVILDQADLEILDFEPFERAPINHAQNTYYETYGRPWNKIVLPDLPQVYPFFENNQTSQDPVASPLYEDGTIATIHFQVDDDKLQKLHTNKMDQTLKIQGTMTYMSYNTIQQFQDAELKIGGHSSREWAKVPYKIKISPKTSPNGLFRRWAFKLRSESTDPTMMREMIYNNLLQATGIVAARGIYARFFLNDKPVGLYLLVDDSSTKRFIRETIHYGEDDAVVGDIIKGDAGKGSYAANLGYRGASADDYDSKVYEIKAKTAEKKGAIMERLIDLIKFIHDYDPTDAPTDEAGLLAQWNKYIDIKRFIRQLAVEWIGGNWDGVQYSGNNYALYRKVNTTQFISIPMDFDYTFGNGLEEDQRNLMTGRWTEFTAGRDGTSYLWEKLKTIPYFVDFYQRTLQEIVARVANPEFLFKRIDGLAYMLHRDIVWDRSLTRLSSGVTRPWSGDDFLFSLDQGSGQKDELIGLKEWIQAKAASITQMMDSHPSVEELSVRSNDVIPEQEEL